MQRTWKVVLIGVAACHHSGGALVESSATLSDEQGVIQLISFSWSRDADPSGGSLRARLPDGTRLVGGFLQVDAALSLHDAAPYYYAWNSPRWGVGSPWYEGSPSSFVTDYTGLTLAHLRSDDGRRMRCNFMLHDPSRGFVRGAEGRCQLSDGAAVYEALMVRKAD